MAVLIFLAVLFVLILVHEWGHYIVAKLTGMRVDEFGIGFPPKIFGMKRGETTYTLNALPIGGFVKIYGEDPTDVAGVGDQTRAFSARPKWAQALVLIAGVTMNLLFAWLLFLVILLMGVPAAVGEDVATAEAKLIVTEVLSGSPADSLISPQSEIVAVAAGGESLTTLLPSTFSAFIVENGDQPVTISFLKDNQIQEIVVQPRTDIIPESADKLAVGVALTMVETKYYSLWAATQEATGQTIQTTKAIIFGLSGLIAQTFSGTADFSQVAGPIGIVEYVGEAAAFGFTSLLLFTAVISLNLAVINLLPIPALDGGRLVFVAIETIIRRPIPPVWASRVNFAGFTFLMLLMLAVTYNDIMKFF